MGASTFQDIEAIFRRVCGPRRDVHCARRFEDIASEVEDMNPADQYGDQSGDDPEPDKHLGDIGRPILAWAYECEGPALAVIHHGASEIGVESLFMRFADVDQHMPNPPFKPLTFELSVSFEGGCGVYTLVTDATADES